MSNTTNTKAIVLYYTPWREHDRLYTIYTERFGKQRMRAHGVQKIKSKLAGSLEPFAEIDLFIIQAKGMNKIGGAVIIDRFSKLSTELPAQNAAWYCTEVFSRLTEENIYDIELYTLLYSILTWLDHYGAHQAVVRGFVIKLIRALGYDLASETTDPDIQKVIRWYYEQPFDEMQKIRFTEKQWSRLLLTLKQWFYTHDSGHVQSEKFLV